MFNVISILLIFPAMLSVDLRRRRARMYDLACCWSEPRSEETALPCTVFGSREHVGSPAPPAKKTAVTRAGRGGEVVTYVSEPPAASLTRSVESIDSVASTRTLVRPARRSESGGGAVFCGQGRRRCRRLGVQWLVERHYLSWVVAPPFRLVVLLASVVSLGAGVWGACQVRDGLDLTDLVPRGSDEYAFLDVQRRYFGFFNMFAVTQGNFEYPTNQRLLQEYHQAFTRVPRVIKNDDGGLPDFWLTTFRDWLLGKCTKLKSLFYVYATCFWRQM